MLSASPTVTGQIIGVTTTPRLSLRPIEKCSVELLEPIFAKEEVWRFPYGRPLTRAETEAFVSSQVEHWETLGFGLWTVFEHGSPICLGYVGLSVPTFFPEILPAVEVGWRLDPEVWGRGYATEGALAALHAAFDSLHLEQVISLPQTENPASVRVAERIGMRHGRTAMAPATAKRGPVEVAVMVISREHWKSRAPVEP